MDKTGIKILGTIVAVASVCAAVVALREDSLYTEPESTPLCEITPESGAININTATISELCTLDGIGRSTAAAIVDYRTNTRRFEDIHDIMQISGVGEKTFERIKTKIRVK